MKMDDPSNFVSGTEYNVFVYVVGVLFISECLIWMLTSKRTKNSSRKSSDKGTVWLVIIGWCCCLTIGAFFRGQNVPELMRNLLLPHFSYYIGVCLIVLGIIFRCTAVLSLKGAFTLSVQTTSDQYLVKTGLYHLVRNPAYTGSIMSLLGVNLAYRHILGVVAAFIICLGCYGVRIKIEEKVMEEQFREEFIQYCIETKYKLFPGLY